MHKFNEATRERIRNVETYWIIKPDGEKETFAVHGVSGLYGFIFDEFGLSERKRAEIIKEFHVQFKKDYKTIIGRSKLIKEKLINYLNEQGYKVIPFTRLEVNNRVRNGIEIGWR